MDEVTVDSWDQMLIIQPPVNGNSLGHSAAFLQLNDIFTTNLSASQARVYLEDLDQYLEMEELRFRYCARTRPSDAAELVLDGLDVLHQVVKAALQQPRPDTDTRLEWLQFAVEADEAIQEGKALLGR